VEGMGHGGSSGGVIQQWVHGQVTSMVSVRIANQHWGQMGGVKHGEGPVRVPISIRGTREGSSMLRGPSMLRGSVRGASQHWGQMAGVQTPQNRQRRHTAVILGWHTCPADVRWFPWCQLSRD